MDIKSIKQMNRIWQTELCFSNIILNLLKHNYQDVHFIEINADPALEKLMLPKFNIKTDILSDMKLLK